MRVVFIAPRIPLGADDLQRALKGLGYRWPELNEFVIVCEDSIKQHYEQCCPRVPVYGFESERGALNSPVLTRASIILSLLGRDGAFWIDPKAIAGREGLRVYKTDYTGIVLLADDSIDEIEYPKISSHTFMADAKGLPNARFCYFPYGYLFRYAGLGPLNEFGHRINLPLSVVAERPPNVKLVAVFGGSAAWSMYCMHDEMFASLVQDRLNRAAEELGKNERFMVLNFAQHGNVVLNEMLTFMLFCIPLRPEVVIAHDGFNDLAYGQMTDPNLLDDFNIVYQTNVEAWGALLHISPAPTPRSISNPPCINYPKGIVAAYLERSMQFQKMAEGCTNSVFISGLQPAVFQKQKLSERESGWLGKHHPDKFSADFIRKMPFLYEKYRQLDPGRYFRHYIDFPLVFNGYGDDVDLFGDVVHTVPAGDVIIADTYCDYITREVFALVSR